MFSSPIIVQCKPGILYSECYQQYFHILIGIWGMSGYPVNKLSGPANSNRISRYKSQRISGNRSYSVRVRQMLTLPMVLRMLVDQNMLRTYEVKSRSVQHTNLGTMLLLFTCTVFAKELLGDHIHCIR